MATVTSYERLSALINNAVAAGHAKNPAEVLRAAGLSTGYLGELKKRCADNPSATIMAKTAIKLAEVLGVSLYDVTGAPELPIDDDADIERSWAVSAARQMQLPEAAIQKVLRESPGAGDRRYWMLRIETVARQLDWPPTSRSHKV